MARGETVHPSAAPSSSPAAQALDLLLDGRDAARAAALAEHAVLAPSGLAPRDLPAAVEVLTVCSPLRPEVVEALARRLRSATEDGALSVVAGARARLAVRTGRTGSAWHDVAAALDTPGPDRRQLLPLALHLRLVTGDLHGAAGLAAELSADPAVDGPLAARSSWALAELEAARGDHEQALAHHLRAGRLLAPTTRQPAVLSWRLGAALALAQLGRIPQARALAEEDLAGVEAFGAPYPRARSLRTLATLRPLAALALLRQALQLLDGVAADRLLHQLRTDLATHLLLHHGPRKEAVALLRSVEGYAAGEGLAPMLGRARRLLALAGEPPRRHPVESRGRLTVAEERIAALASRGLSNRLVAVELGLSPHSVQWHLSQIYRRLGISGRKELAAAIGPTDKSGGFPAEALPRTHPGP